MFFLSFFGNNSNSNLNPLFWTCFWLFSSNLMWFWSFVWLFNLFSFIIVNKNEWKIAPFHSFWTRLKSWALLFGEGSLHCGLWKDTNQRSGGCLVGEKSKKLSFLNEKHVRKCQILTNVHQKKRKKMERTKKRSQRDGGSLPELLVITHCLHTSLDNKKTHLDKTKKIKNFIYMVFAYILILTKTKILVYMVFAYILFFKKVNPFS